MIVIDYNGEGRWSHHQIIRRYGEYADELGVVRRQDLSPTEHTERERHWIYPVMDNDSTRAILMKKQTNSKKKAVTDRIRHLEEAIAKGSEYLESGKHEKWAGFRPLFDPKVRNEKELPPHRDWVKNVFLPGMEKALARAEKVLEKLK